MSGMDKYSKFLDNQQDYVSPFQSTRVSKTSVEAAKEVKNIRDSTGKSNYKKLEESKPGPDNSAAHHMINRLKNRGWHEKHGVDDKTTDEYTVLSHPAKGRANHEYYIDNDGKHFYHFHHKDGKTNIDAGVSNTLGAHLKHMKYDDKMKKEEVESESDLIQMDEAAVGAAGKALVGGLSKIAGHIARHAGTVVDKDREYTDKAAGGIKKALGTVGHVDLLTHSLGSTGTFSLQAGFLRRKDENGRETGPHKFNLRVRHDNWRTGQRTVRDLVGREYEKKAVKSNDNRTFKPRFRFGRGLTKDKQTTADSQPKPENTQPEQQKPQAYDAFADKSKSDETSGEDKAKKKIKKFSSMKAPKDNT